MPIIHIMGTKLSEEQQDKIAAESFENVFAVLNIPSIKTFFSGFERFYANGNPAEGYQFDVVIEGPDITKEQTEMVTKGIYDSMVSVLEEVKDVAVVYHVNDHEHVSSNGVLLANRSHAE